MTTATSNQIQVELDRQLQECPSKADTVLGLGYEEVSKLSSLFLEGIIDIDWNVTTLIFGIRLSLRKYIYSLRTTFVTNRTIVKATISVKNMLMDKLHSKATKYGNFHGWVSLPASP